MNPPLLTLSPHMNTHRRAIWISRLVTALGLLGLGFFTSCTTTSGKFATPKAIAEMSDEDFDGYLERVAAWASVAGQMAVRQGADPEKVTTYCLALEAISDPDGGSLLAAAVQAGLDSPLAQLLVIEAQALLDARGGLPGGPRGKALLHAVAHSVRYGVGVGVVEKASK